MIFEELLQLHLDGVLAGADQAELFHILAVSDEKRQIFNEHTRLRAAINSDRVAGRVPATLSERTLQTALGQGHTMPVATQTARSASGVLVSALVAAGLMLGGVVGYSLGTNRDLSQTRVQESPSSTTSTMSPVAVQAENSSAPSTAATTPIANRVTMKPVSHQFANTEQREEFSSTTNATSAAPVAGAIDLGKSDATPRAEHNVEPEKVVYMPQQGNHEPFYSSRDGIQSMRNVDAEPAQFEIDLTQGTHIAQNALNTSGLPVQPMFSLFRLRGGIKINEHLSAGVLVGQNLFALHYTEPIDNV